MTEKLIIEAGTYAFAAQSYAGHPAVGIRFRHNENSSVVVGISVPQALELISQLAGVVKSS